MKKLVFSDLDETLLVNWHVPEFNQKAVARAREAGHIFVPCTGRPPFMMDEILDELSMHGAEDEYVVCFNGGIIFQLKDKKVLYFRGHSHEDVKTIMAIAENSGLCALVFTPTELHLCNPDPNEVDRKRRQGVGYIAHDGYDPAQFEGLNIVKIMLIHFPGQPYLKEQVYDKLPEEIREKYEISFSSNRYMEFNPKGVSKGEAVRFLAEYLNIPIEDTIGIGDNYNDVEMLKAVGTSCCVSSAVPVLKEFCAYVCEKDYMDGAVKEVLERFCP